MKVGFKTTLKILLALDRAEDVKKLLRRLHGVCYVHESYCKCREGQLCNMALAEFLQVDKGTVLKQWRAIMWELEELGIISTEKVKNPANRPRRLIWLNGNLGDVLVRVIGETNAEIWENWKEDLCKI